MRGEKQVPLPVNLQNNCSLPHRGKLWGEGMSFGGTEEPVNLGACLLGSCPSERTSVEKPARPLAFVFSTMRKPSL